MMRTDEKNFQGDITGIFNEAGTQVVWYDYDAWGNRVGGAWVVHNQDIYKNLFYANPFRYRGYYQDSETGFYYCGSRYYDPKIGRFINADSTNTLMNTPMAYTDKNLYAYCDNNPVMRVDNGGEFWDTVFDVISLCVSVVDVVKNPDDPWAWAGLAADVVSLVVPFATGGGLIVDVATKADDVVDLAKNLDNVSDTADTIYDGVKAYTKADIPDCFIAGTLISTAEGAVSIEDISVGDYVWSMDSETGTVALKQVVETFVNETTAVTHVTINGEIITSTQTHPYYVEGKGWVLAQNLHVGDILVMLNGERVILELVQHEILETPVITYNFEVEGFHTYFVGDSGIFVHNKCKPYKYMTNQDKNILKNEIKNSHDVTFLTKSDAEQFVLDNYTDFPKEIAGGRSAKGWHFDEHPINGEMRKHINIYSKTDGFRAHILWKAD